MAKDHPTGNSGLYRAFLQLKTPEECYRFLQDVCSYSELSAMEQRYNIAELLADKCIYTEIMDKTGASSAIISRVSRVLHCDIAALGGKQPEKDCKLGIDEDGFVRNYYVASSVCEMGMLRVELEAIDECAM